MNSVFTELNNKELLDINGGVAPAIIAAIIAAGVTITITVINYDMDNAVEQGKNDAYNDMNNTPPLSGFNYC